MLDEGANISPTQAIQFLSFACLIRDGDLPQGGSRMPM
jgi:hypothetical protein